MGTLIKKTIVNNTPGSSEVPMQYFLAFWNTVDCSLIKSCTLSNKILTINIDDTIQLVFNANANYILYIIDDTGTQKSGCTFNTFREYFDFNIYFTDTFFYFQFRDAHSVRYILVYEKINGKRYFGYNYAEIDTHWFSITEITLKQVEDQSNYKYNQILNYSCELDNIDYSSNILFNSNDEITDIIDSNTLTCTPVPIDYVITFRGSNYYSIGSNTLVEVDL